MKKFTLLAMLLLGSFVSFGQTLINYYAFYEDTGTYQPLTSGVRNWYGTDSDDELIANQAFGFNFYYNGTQYTGASISSNGAITLEPGNTVNYSNHLEGGTGTSNTYIIAPLWDDLYIRSADNGQVWYNTLGVAPNRRFVVDWQNVSWRNTGETVSFQVILYETTNNIEFIYGPNNSTESRSASIGINYVANDFMSVTPGIPAFVSSTTANNSISSNNYPGENKVYKFKHWTYVPDDNFEAYCESQGFGNSIDNDNYISSILIADKTSLSLSGQDIHDLTGIEDFKSIVSFYCFINNIPNVDLTKNTLLTTVNINKSHIQTLDVSTCVNLNKLYLIENELTSLDVHLNTILTELSFSDNLISGTVTTSFCPNLKKLYADNNQLTSLYLDNNSALEILDCNNNNLSSFSIQNGANNLLSGTYTNGSVYPRFSVTNNPDLTCIYVDNATDANNGVGDYLDWEIDPTSHFVETVAECNVYNDATYVPDDNFENYLETHNASGAVVAVGDASSLGNGTANDNYVTTSKIETVTSLSINSLSITNLTGIEDFTALETLSCYNNSISSVDLSNNTNLTSLTIRFNSLSSLDLSNNTALTQLDCKSNQISTLDLSNNLALTTISASSNGLGSVVLGNNTSLSSLYLSNNNLSSISLTQLTGLTTLYLDNNQFTSIDISANTALVQLSCNDNTLSSLNLDTNTSLEGLSCNNNNLNSLALNNVTSLTGIDCRNNNLTSLDLTHQIDIENISCSYNQITNLSISEGYYGQSDLMYLYCDHNQITELDVSGLETIEELEVQNNSLTLLNIANGNNSSFGNFDARNNPNLTCIKVDDATYMNTNWSNYIDATASYSENCHYDETYVPDDNFENYLETHDASGAVVAVGDATSLGNGTANDNYVTTSIIENITVLDISEKSIADLTGIEDFTALTDLNCENNYSLGSLDISHNIALTSLNCGMDSLSELNLTNNINLINLQIDNNQITNIDLSPCSSLTELRCSYNSFTSLDVSQNTALTILYCGNNNLTSIDVSQNTDLNELYCSYNTITSINISQNTALNELYCSNNPITNIDVSLNTDLTKLYCENTSITILDISHNTDLTHLHCSTNSLTNLDISNNPNLIQFECSNSLLTHLDASNNSNLETFHCNDSQLVGLDIRNGNNPNIAGSNFSATGNSDLTCIYVDDASWSTSNWSLIDATTNFVNDEAACTALTDTYVPDDNFENYLETHDASGTVVPVGDASSLGNGIADDDYVTTSAIENLILLNISSLHISDLTGIADFTAIEELHCRTNDLTTLDMSNNTALTYLDCSYNNLTTLDFSTNTLLTDLYCFGNDLTTLNITANTALEVLNCSINNFTSIDISENIALTTFYCYSNNLSNLDLSTNTTLANFSCSSNNLTSLNVSANPHLNYVDCSNNDLTNINLGNNTTLRTFYCQFNQLTTLDLNANTGIYNLFIYNNNLTGIDLSTNTELQFLRCENNNLTGLDLSTNIHLQKFDARDNDLTTLDIRNGANNLLQGNYTTSTSEYARFRATGNPNLTCIFVDDATAANSGAEPYTSWEKDISAHYVGSMSECNAFDDTLTYVPDDNFEAYLEANSMGNGIDNDNYVTTANIENVAVLNVGSLNISDLTGIEDFTNLVHLYCDNNQLANLDVSHNLELIWLYCNNNSITSLDLSNNTALTKLNCTDNQVTNLDLSQNGNLSELYCNTNQLTSLDLSQNAALERLSCKSNLITDLDLSNNSLLNYMKCSDNLLTGLNIINGNNTNISDTDFDVTNNPDLTCILVDDASWSDANWTNIDPTSHFVNNESECNALGIEDATQVNFKLFPNPVSDSFSIQLPDEEIIQVSIYDIYGKHIKSYLKQDRYNVSNISSGVYMIHIKTSKGYGTEKLIIN